MKKFAIRFAKCLLVGGLISAAMMVNGSDQCHSAQWSWLLFTGMTPLIGLTLALLLDIQDQK